MGEKKLETRRLDLVVANDVTQAGAGFETDTNIVSLVWPNGRTEALPLLSKQEVANHVLDAVSALFKTAPTSTKEPQTIVYSPQAAGTPADVNLSATGL